MNELEQVNKAFKTKNIELLKKYKALEEREIKLNQNLKPKLQ